MRWPKPWNTWLASPSGQPEARLAVAFGKDRCEQPGGSKKNQVDLCDPFQGFKESTGAQKCLVMDTNRLRKGENGFFHLPEWFLPPNR